MLLSNPPKIPKISKKRAKKGEAAIKAIPQKRPDKIDFSCKTFYKFNNDLRKQYLVFTVETLVEFTAFAYELTVEVIKRKRILYLIIRGLKARTNILPGIQPARTEIEFEDFVGEYVVHVVKQDGAINSAVYNFNIFKKEIKLIKEFIPLKKNNRRFCKFFVSEKDFSFASGKMASH